MVQNSMKRMGVSSLLFIAAVLVVVVVPGTAAAKTFNYTERFDHEIFPFLRPGEQFFLGQEVRLRLLAHTTSFERNASTTAVFNATTGALRVRIVAAYEGRASRGKVIPCNSSAVSVWAETASLGKRTLAYGRHRVIEGFFTFVVPPFPWRICILSTQASSAIYAAAMWRGVEHPSDVPPIRRPNETLSFYSTAQQMNVDDFAAVMIVHPGGAFPFAATVPPTAEQRAGDNVKLVPAGYPCTYERVESRDNETVNDFCGTNMLVPFRAGVWRNDRCLSEGAPTNGVALVGTNKLNPFVDSITAAIKIHSTNQSLVAYLRLPSAGSYDVCYSPATYRAKVQSAIQNVAVPLWFKLMKLKSSCTAEQSSTLMRYNPSCTSRDARLVVSAAGAGSVPTWALDDDQFELSWAAIRVQGSNLSTYPALKWDFKCPIAGSTTCVKEYFNTTGGDVLRIVRASKFISKIGTSGKLSFLTAGGKQRYSVVNSSGREFGQERLLIERASLPPQGTTGPIGCWFSDQDNDGNCASCNTGDSGPTMSSDLGGSPHRGDSAYLLDESAVNMSFAYIRIPRGGDVFYVCYRQSGAANWRVLQWRSSSRANLRNTISPIPSGSNFTYTLNDTRGTTLAPFAVHHTSAVLNTLKSSADADGNMIGSVLKLVKETDPCYTAAAQSISNDPGLAECSVPNCIGGTCTDCKGSFDETATLRKTIFFYVHLPPYESEEVRYRVCFRNRNGNWLQLQNSKMSLSQLLVLQPNPTVKLRLLDRRAESWAPFVFYKSDGRTLNVMPHNGVHGAIFRLVINSSNCDIPWGVSGSPQSFNSSMTITDLGVQCTASTSVGNCASSTIHPSHGVLNATAPYFWFNPNANSEAASLALGFLTIPSRTMSSSGGRVLSTAYKICFREGYSNWHIVDQLVPTAKEDVALDAPAASYVAGSYGFLAVRASSYFVINIRSALLKLVNSTSRCHEAPEGTQTVDGMYSAFSMATHRGSRWTDTNNVVLASGQVKVARAWITFPSTFSGLSSQFRVCYGTNSAQANWKDLGMVTIVSRQISFFVDAQPYNNGVATIRFVAGGSTLLNASSGGDAAKVVSVSSPCADAFPSDVSSLHVGLEMDVNSVTRAMSRTSGITDLSGADDSSPALSTFLRMTMPGSTSQTFYRVCYKPRGGVWQELNQADRSLRKFDLGNVGLNSHISGVDSLSIVTSLLTGQAPSSGVKYYGTEFTKCMFTGASTIFTASSVSDGTAVTHGFSVLGTGLGYSDELKLLRIATETSPGIWATPMVRTCEDANLEFTVRRNPDSSTTTRSDFDFALPMTPGEYLFCYKKYGASSSWIQLPNSDGLNPALIISTNVYVRVHESALQVVDGAFVSQRLHSSLWQLDRLYLANYTAVCGINGTADGNTSIKAAAAYLSGTPDYNDFTVYSELNATSVTFYPITSAGTYVACYYKSLMNTTVSQNGFVPFARSGVWYRIPFFYQNSMSSIYSVQVSPAALVAQCPPPTNVSVGVPFEVQVKIVDLNGNLVPSILPIDVTAVAANSWVLWSEGTTCRSAFAARYGTTEKLTHTRTGVASFLVQSRSACPATQQCQLKFTTSGGLVSNLCQFNVKPSAAARIIVSQGPASCRLNQQCILEFTALQSNGHIAYATSGQISFTISQHFGMQYEVNGTTTPGGTISMPLTNGKIVLAVTPKFGNIAEWLMSSASYSPSFTGSFPEVPSLTHTFIVYRPNLDRVSITDLVLCNWDGSEANDILSNQRSKWEPSKTFANAFWNPNETNINVSSVPSYPLVAGQYYMATLVAKDAYGEILESVDVFGASTTITMALQDADASNKVIGRAPSLEESYSYEVPFLPVFFDSVEKQVIFRVKNANGCDAATNGCRFMFLFNGKSLASPTFIETTVLSPATTLRVSCRLPTQTVFQSSCPTSAVEKGLFIKIEALDAFGMLAEFFEGTVYVQLSRSRTDRALPTLTTVSKLSQEATDIALVPLAAVGGVVSYSDLTLTKPCEDCTLTFFSDWSTGRVSIPIVFERSTQQLNCFLSASETYYVVSTDGTSIIGRYDASMSGRINQVAIYTDTDLCFDVEAVNDQSTRTLYESLWVHYSAFATGTKSISITPSAKAPRRYNYLVNSRAKYCMRVQGAAGAEFSVVFTAQKFTSSTHWSSIKGTCSVERLTVRENRFIGSLAIAGITGVTEMNNWKPPKKTVWGYRQLATPTETVDVSLTFHLMDHYGNRIGTEKIAPSQTSFYVSIGKCASFELTQKLCQTGTGANGNGSIIVTNAHSFVEGGMIRVKLQSATSAVTSPVITFRLAVTQFCLKCDIPFYIYNTSTSIFSDAALGPVSASLRLSIILPESTPRYIVFPKGKSPWKTTSLSGVYPQSYWTTHIYNYGSLATNASKPILFLDRCFANVACAPKESLFLQPSSMTSTPNQLTGPNGDALQFFVVRSLSPPEMGEPSCVSDCISEPNWVFSQVDIFTDYKINVSIGTQKLICSADTPCSGNNTAVLSLNYSAAGKTIDSALESSGFRMAQVKIVGTDASEWYEAPSGIVKAVPTKYGAFRAAATNVSDLVSSFGVGDNKGMYYLVWRGSLTVSTVNILATSRSTPSDSAAAYNRFDAPGTSSYTGYMGNSTIDGLKFNYSATRIAVGVPFPLSFEIVDSNGRRVAGKGTVLAELENWLGCNNGGTLNMVSSSSFVLGLGTIWLTFSKPCQQCLLRLRVVPDDKNNEIYGTIAANDLRSLVTSLPITVEDYVSRSATAVYATTNPSTQEGSITIDTLVSVNVATFTNMGPIAIADSSATVHLSAYNKIVPPLNMIVAGNGGILRASSAVTSIGRHGIRSSGVGSASISFAFQRTCAACSIVIAWRLPMTSKSGFFTLRNKVGNTFSVTAGIPTSVIFGEPDRILVRNTLSSIAVWSGQASSLIPFAGFAKALPSLRVPTIYPIDSSGGTGGTLTYNTTLGKASVVYHIAASRTCKVCSISFGSSLSQQFVVRTTATHYRIEYLEPRLLSLGDTVTIKVYASDDDGNIDPSIGGVSSCEYVRPFFCTISARTLVVQSSMDGVSPGGFAPVSSFMSLGGPSVADFSLTTMGNFALSGGQTVPEGISFRFGYVPVIHSKLIITDLYGLSSSKYPSYAFSVDMGLEGLILSTDLPGVDVVVNELLEIKVGFTKLLNGTNQYVAVRPDNTIVIRLKGECKVTLLTPYFVQMVSGIAKFRMKFWGANIGQTCMLTFTSVAGSGKCQGAACTTYSEVKAYQVVATSWDFVSPTSAENGFIGSGPMFAVAGRVQVVQAQLYEIFGGSHKIAHSCGYAACSLVLRARDSCAPQPTISPAGGSVFNANGTATVSVTWKVSGLVGPNGTALGYTCSLITSVLGAAIDGPLTTEFPVVICVPVKLVFMGNHTNGEVLSGVVRTGVSYGFHVGMVDGSGNVCPGDSRYGTATRVKISTINMDGSPTVDISVINLNMTGQTVDSKYTHDAYLVGGTFVFQVVFTNSTQVMKRGPVRVKFEAFSETPAMTVAPLFSPQVETRFSPAALVVDPPLPKFASRNFTYKFDVLVVDAVPIEWFYSNSIPPRSIDFEGHLTMKCELSFRGQLPVQFIEGDPNAAFSSGRVTFRVLFTGADGDYQVRFLESTGVLTPTKYATVTLQSPSTFAIQSLMFRTGAPAACTTDCTLPSPEFSHQVAGGFEYLNASVAQLFRISIVVVDFQKYVTEANTDGFLVGCKVVQPAALTQTANIAIAPALVAEAPLYVPMTKGRANFSIGLVGSTWNNDTQQHDLAHIECFCAKGDCDSFPPTRSLGIAIQGCPNATEEAAALHQRMDAPVLKIPTHLTTIDQFNVTKFRSLIMKVLRENVGISYITDENENDTVSIVACNIVRDFFGFADLRNSVCMNAVENETVVYCAPHNRTYCPPFILACSCPERYIQNFTRNASQILYDQRLMELMGIDVQIEVTLSLDRAPGYRGCTFDEVRAEQLNMQRAVLAALTAKGSTDFAEFEILADTVLTTSRLAPSETAKETPEPSTTTLPPTPPPSNMTETGVAMNFVSVWMILCAVVMVLLL